MLQHSFSFVAVQLLVKTTSALQNSKCYSATSAAQLSKSCSATSIFACGMLQGWGLEGWGLGLADMFMPNAGSLLWITSSVSSRVILVECTARIRTHRCLGVKKESKSQKSLGVHKILVRKIWFNSPPPPRENGPK